MLNEEEMNKIVNTIITVKKINDNFFKNQLFKLIKNYNKLIENKKRIRELYKEKFDKDNKQHVEILYQIWEILKGNRDIELIDQRWCKLNYFIFK
jgi:hypothetical protein